MQLPWYDTAKNAVYIPKNLYRYRFNPNSVTNMKFNDQLFNMAVFLLAETFPYFEKWKVPNPEIICNRQFYSRVSGAFKQFYLKGSGLSKSQKKKYLLDIPVEDVLPFEAALFEYVDTKYPEIPESIRTEKVLTEDTEKALIQAIEECKKSYK